MSKRMFRADLNPVYSKRSSMESCGLSILKVSRMILLSQRGLRQMTDPVPLIPMAGPIILPPWSRPKAETWMNSTKRTSVKIRVMWVIWHRRNRWKTMLDRCMEKTSRRGTLDKKTTPTTKTGAQDIRDRNQALSN